MKVPNAFVVLPKLVPYSRSSIVHLVYHRDVVSSEHTEVQAPDPEPRIRSLPSQRHLL